MMRLGVVALLAALAGCGARSVLGDEEPVRTAGTGGASAGAATTVVSGPGPGSGGNGTGGVGGTGGMGGIDLVISESGESFLEAETDLAVSATGRIAAAWIADGFDGHSFIGAAFSNGGASWAPLIHVVTPEAKDGSDPVLAVDAAGNFYLAWIGFHRNPQGKPIQTSVYFARAGAADSAFGPTVEIASAGDNDKPWITLTPGGAVLVSWVAFEPKLYELRSARSDNGGMSFSTASVVKDPTLQAAFQHARPCVAANNQRVWISFVRFTLNGNTAQLTYSDDDGKSWHSPPLNLSKSLDVAHTDTACVAAGTEVWVMYGLNGDPPSDATNPSLTGLRVAHSSDAGASSDALFTIGDGSGKPNLVPQMANGQDGLHFSYYRGAALDDPSGAMIELSADRNTGKMLGSRTLHQPIVYQNKRASSLWLGDYTGLRVVNGTTYAVFADNAVDGNSHIRFTRSP